MSTQSGYIIIFCTKMYWFDCYWLCQTEWLPIIVAHQVDEHVRFLSCNMELHLERYLFWWEICLCTILVTRQMHLSHSLNPCFKLNFQTFSLHSSIFLWDEEQDPITFVEIWLWFRVPKNHRVKHLRYLIVLGHLYSVTTQRIPLDSWRLCP